MTPDIRPITHAEALSLVKSHHYLGTLPRSVQTNFGLYENDRLVAVASYGPVHSAKMPKDWLELRRLVKHPECILQLSQFLAATLRILKKRGDVGAVMSWADPSANHHGGIYQATNWVYTEPYSYNWNYSFKTDSGEIIDHRKAFKLFGTSSKHKVLALNPTWTAFLPPMKYRYMMPLATPKASCLALIKATERPYPKPAIAGEHNARPTHKRRKEFRETGRS